MSKNTVKIAPALSLKAQKLADLDAMKKAISKDSPFHSTIAATLEKVLAEKEESRHEKIMNEIDKNYRIELQKEYKVSHIFMGQEFVRRLESRAALNAFMKKLTVDVNLTVTVTSRSIYVA